MVSPFFVSNTASRATLSSVLPGLVPGIHGATLKLPNGRQTSRLLPSQRFTHGLGQYLIAGRRSSSNATRSVLQESSSLPLCDSHSEAEMSRHGCPERVRARRKRGRSPS
jgi:hypothetical protein